jgi:hypothetical protein
MCLPHLKLRRFQMWRAGSCSWEGADKPIEARDPQEQTHEANPTGPHFGVDQVERHNQPMQEGETRYTVKKGRDSRTLIKTLLVRAPRLQRRA